MGQLSTDLLTMELYYLLVPLVSSGATSSMVPCDKGGNVEMRSFAIEL